MVYPQPFTDDQLNRYTRYLPATYDFDPVTRAMNVAEHSTVHIFLGEQIYYNYIGWLFTEYHHHNFPIHITLQLTYALYFTYFAQIRRRIFNDIRNAFNKRFLTNTDTYDDTNLIHDVRIQFMRVANRYTMATVLAYVYECKCYCPNQPHLYNFNDLGPLFITDHNNKGWQIRLKRPPYPCVHAPGIHNIMSDYEDKGNINALVKHIVCFF